MRNPPRPAHRLLTARYPALASVACLAMGAYSIVRIERNATTSADTDVHLDITLYSVAMVFLGLLLLVVALVLRRRAKRHAARVA